MLVIIEDERMGLGARPIDDKPWQPISSRFESSQNRWMEFGPLRR
jgi:hypothetical protein